MSDYKQCIKGHFYKEETCPYCKAGENIYAETNSPADSRCDNYDADLQKSCNGYIVGDYFYSDDIDDYPPPPSYYQEEQQERQFQHCANGHYFAVGMACPFCGAEESQKSREGEIDYSQTLFQCPKCGNWTPVRQRICMYCGADLYESASPSNGQTRPEYTPDHISQLAPNEIFVFGSNLQGAHGGGAARYAYEHFGAEWGVGVGMTGHCYAIPTMHGGPTEIKPYVDRFINFAKKHPEYLFYVTPIGCGIAGFTPEQIAPLFFSALDVPNIVLPRTFCDVLRNDEIRVDCDGHIYLLRADHTASLLYYSEDAYHLYKRYKDWIIEAYEGEKYREYEKHFGGDELSFSIPDTIIYEDREYRVTRIEEGAFAFCVLLSVEIPDSIVSIGNSAFYRCIGLSTIIMPDSVEHIETGAVYDCPNLIYLKWRGKTHYSTVDNPIVFPPLRQT